MKTLVSARMHGPLAAAALAVASAFAFSSPALAGPAQSSASVNIASVTAATGSQGQDLFTLASHGGGLVLSKTALSPMYWTGGTGELTGMGSGLSSVINSPVNFSFGNLTDFTLISGIGTFTAASDVPVPTASGTVYSSPEILGGSGAAGSGSETVSIYEVGYFTGAGTLSTLVDQPMSLTLAFTESASGPIDIANVGSFSLSATAALPASPEPSPGNYGNPIPEPTTIALLGTALFGLGAVRRRRH